MLGIGAAWYEREHLALGVPYPPIAERFERLEETLQICNQMWSDNDGPYDGKHYHLAETLCHPEPIQQPRPKILIGGGGERKTLKLVARYADACNLFALGAAEVQRKLDILAQHCEDEGRDMATIKKTMNYAGDPNRRCRRLPGRDGGVRRSSGSRWSTSGTRHPIPSPPPRSSPRWYPGSPRSDRPNAGRRSPTAAPRTTPG